MKELTDNTPKALLRVAGRSLIEYALDALPDPVDEVIIIVGYLGGMIHDALGPQYFGKKILYVEQGEQHGTAGALWSAKDVLKEKFLVTHADDMYSAVDLAKMAVVREWGLLVKEVDPIGEGGKIVVHDDKVKAIIEGTHGDVKGRVSAGVYTLDRRIFDQSLIPKSEGSEEFGLPQTILAAVAARHILLEAVEASFWIQITAPEDLTKADELLARSAV